MAAQQKLEINIEAKTAGKTEVESLISTLAKAGVDVAPFRAEAEKLDAELKQLAQQQGLIDSFKSQKTATEATKEAMDLAQQKAQELAKALKTTEAANKDAKVSFDAAKAAVQGFAEPLADAKAKVAALEDSFAKSKTVTQELKDQLALARVEVKSLTAPSEEVANRFNQLSAELKTAETNTKAEKDALAAAKNEVRNLSGEMALAQTNVKNAAAALKQGETAAKDQSIAFTAARTAVKDTSAEYQASVVKLQDLRQGLANTGINTKDLSTAQTTLKQKLSENAGELGTLQSKIQGAQAAQGKLTEQTKQSASTFDAISEKIKLVNGALLGLAGVTGIKNVTELADAYKNLEARVKLATGEGAGFQTAFNGVFDVAKRTNGVVADTGTLFTKIYEAGKVLNESQKEQIALAEKMGATQSQLKAMTNDMVMSQGEALKLTETINQTVQLSGSSAEASSAAIIQLIQGLQSGVLRGEEFNSVMEQAPRLARALADGLGVGIGELRKMAEQGQLTSQTVIKALENQSDAVATEFNKLPPTVGRAMQTLQTNFMQYVGEVDKAGGYTKTLASGIDVLAGNIKIVANVMLHAGEIMAALKLKQLAADWLMADAAVKKNTVSTAENTAAQAASATAVANTGKAATASAGLLGTMGSAVGALIRSFAPLLALDVALHFKEYGTAIGEGIAKMMGFKDANKVVQEEEKRLTAAIEEASAAKRRNAAAAQEAADRAMGLSKQARKLVTDFDDARKSGDSVDEALKKIGKDFDLNNIPGIKNAAGVMDKLAKDGKASVDQLNAAWSDALKGVDLQVFQTQFKASMDIMRAEAAKAAADVEAAIAAGVTGKELLALEEKARLAFGQMSVHVSRFDSIVGAALQESLKRTGLDTELLSTGMGKAAKSALNDTETLIAGLDKLKSQGIDTGQALVASLSKGIDTADSVKAVKAVEVQIESLRKELGTPMTDDLLLKAAQHADVLMDKLTMLKPGFDDLGRAAKQAGMDVDELMGGVSKKFTDSITAVENVSRELAKVGNVSETAKKQIADALDQRLAAAKTVEEIELVQQALRKAGDAGTISGKKIADGLQKAREKSDDLKPGINSASEAFKKLGLQAPEDMKKAASEMGTAFDKIARSGTASAEQLKDGFNKYAQSALAASGSVGSETWRVQAALLAEKAALQGLSVSFDNHGGVAVKTQIEIQEEIARTNAELEKQAEQLDANARKAAEAAAAPGGGGGSGGGGPKIEMPNFESEAQAEVWKQQKLKEMVDFGNLQVAVGGLRDYGNEQAWIEYQYQKGIENMKYQKSMKDAASNPASSVSNLESFGSKSKSAAESYGQPYSSAPTTTSAAPTSTVNNVYTVNVPNTGVSFNVATESDAKKVMDAIKNGKFTSGM